MGQPPMAAPSEPRYTTRFITTAHRYTPSKEEQHEALASLDQLKTLLPQDIDPQQDIDLTYFVGNLAVPQLVNQNDDGITLESGLDIAKRFERRQVNIEHNRKQIVGYILKAGFSEFGSNRLLTEDEVRAADKPFNIAIVAAIWKVANRDLADFIQEMGAPASPDQDALSLSFEVGFNSYDIAVLPVGVADLSQAIKVIPGPQKETYDDEKSAQSAIDEFEKWDKLLRVNKGKGTLKGGERVVRILSGALVALGAGVVTVPAAQVKGIDPILTKPGTEWSDDIAADNGYAYSSTQFTLHPDDARAFLDYGKTIPDKHIYEDIDHEGHTYGRETEPHITCLYGIKGNSHACVAQAISDFDPVTITLGCMSSFEDEDKPYDVLKIDVAGDQHLQNLYHAVKANTENHTEWLDYHPHLTIAYLKRGMAAHYVGDNRFEGQKLTFSHLTFSPSEGNKIHIPLKQSTSAVYIGPTTSMTAKAVRIKIPAGLTEKAKKLNYPKADVTLSDGRVLKGITVFSGEELDLDKELADLQGVVITDMTPCMEPGIDDATNIHPHVNQEFPTKTPEARKDGQWQGEDDRREILRNLPYTDAILKHLEAAARILHIIDTKSSVLSTTTDFNNQSTASLSSMKLEDLKQLEAKVKNATKPEELTEAMANVALFVEEIAKAGEQYAKAAEQAKKDKEEAEKTSEALKKDLAEAKKTLEEIKAAQASQLAEAKFQERMTSIAELFDLDDEARAYVAEEVRACADDASFEKYLTKAKKVMKGSIKTKNEKTADDNNGTHPKGHEGKMGKETVESTDAAKKSKKMDKEDDDGDYDGDEDDKDHAKAALASAKANPTDKLDVDLIGDVKSLSLRDQYMKAFAEGASVGGRKIKDIVITKK